MKKEKYTGISFSTISNLIGEQKYGEAINYLQKLIEADNTNPKALMLIELIKEILKFQNRDIFSSTNLDMDPWLD